MKKYIYITILMLASMSVFGQQVPSLDINQAIVSGSCFKALIEIDKSNLLDSNNRQSFNGLVGAGKQGISLEIEASPSGQVPNPYNMVRLQFSIKNKITEEVMLTYQGSNEIYRADRISAFQDNFGYHYELGDQGGNVLESLVKTDLVKIHISEMVCGEQLTPSGNMQLPPTVPSHVLPANPNAGCADLHDAIEAISSKMYPWPHEDKGKAWSASQTRQIYDLPGGCVGRDDEVNKLFNIAQKLYPDFHEDDERYQWFKEMLTLSFGRRSNYRRDRLGDSIDEIMTDAGEIFPWHKEDEKRQWVTKKIKSLLVSNN